MGQIRQYLAPSNFYYDQNFFRHLGDQEFAERGEYEHKIQRTHAYGDQSTFRIATLSEDSGATLVEYWSRGSMWQYQLIKTTQGWA